MIGFGHPGEQDAVRIVIVRTEEEVILKHEGKGAGILFLCGRCLLGEDGRTEDEGGKKDGDS